MKKFILISICHWAKKVTLVFFLLVFLYGTSIAQTVRYVATTGNDVSGTGTLANPYLTIQKAISAATTLDGDTIKVAAGTYIAPATTRVSKSLVILGTGILSSDVILDRGSYATSAIVGLTIKANNVTIKKIKVTNYNIGISDTAAISNLKLDSVQLVENWGAGFYSIFSITNLAITNSTISYNGNKTGVVSNSPLKRGIYLLNGITYSTIYINNNTVERNDSTGIEISSAISATTSIDSVTITNNIVRYNKEAQVSVWLGTSTPLNKAIAISNNTIILSDSSRYGIELRNPSGNGKTSGTGSVVVANNTISVVSHTGNSRDMAAIAITRRKENAAATVNDQPQGVVVSGNTINDFQNPKAGDAYGIVFGGTGHKVFNNIITNTEFSLQLQKGNINSGSNLSTTDVINQANNSYFDRDNSNDVCVEVGSNTITGSGSARLTTAAGVTSLTLPVVRTTNTTSGVRFCTLQQAIDFKATVTGNTITADAGTYDEQVTISKGLIIDGVDSSNRLATFTGTPVGTKGVFIINSQNVTVKNFKFIVDQSKLFSAIITSGDASNLLITGNNVLSDNPLAGTLVSPYGSRNGIWVLNSSNITVQSNTINAVGSVKFVRLWHYNPLLKNQKQVLKIHL